MLYRSRAFLWEIARTASSYACKDAGVDPLKLIKRTPIALLARLMTGHDGNEDVAPRENEALHAATQHGIQIELSASLYIISCTSANDDQSYVGLSSHEATDYPKKSLRNYFVRAISLTFQTSAFCAGSQAASYIFWGLEPVYFIRVLEFPAKTAIKTKMIDSSIAMSGTMIFLWRSRKWLLLQALARTALIIHVALLLIVKHLNFRRGRLC
eukprot:4541666-Amphidinium_carterae.1